MSDLPKSYEASLMDTKWYQFWNTRQFFKADPLSSKPSYCIVMPPPNVTGVLHVGHALVNTLQDVLIRFHRMKGFESLWIPGTDHAGISTQTVVERDLIRREGKKKSDYSREEFVDHVWKWKEQSESRILEQLKRLGCSCDWSRLRFTMDEGNNQAVRVMFKKLFDKGLIYRGDYLVNWDPVTQTALADDEVEYEEHNSFLWFIKYPLSDGSGFISIATTRPETMLGDTAVAVSSRDTRYSALIGKTVTLPLIGRTIPIIADHHVDPTFGTGALKITPAHDPNDYQIGLTHKLPFITIMTPEGRINENGGSYAGLTMSEAREAIVKQLSQENLLEKIEPHMHRVGVSYRSKAKIEPFLSKQWFIKMEQFAPRLHEAVSSDKVKLIPAHWKKTYFHWIEHLRDWCISRQLWWGHRIPIWYHTTDSTRIICYDGLDVPPEVSAHPEEWIQDTDVLDTWFSSALWPFATLGWPEKTSELAKFYPNSTLITGHDILFFWVARMLLMGEYAMKEAPFPQAFLHGLIYGRSYWRTTSNGSIAYVTEKERSEYDLGKTIPPDVFSKWEKMSKSKGNIIDPLEMIDLYGTDAVRIALCASATQARQIDLDRRKFEECKNFINKIWNGARFVLLNLQENQMGQTALSAQQFCGGLDASLFSLEDRWILSTLYRTVKEVNHHLTHYEFDQAAMRAYDFFWKEFCAYYVELVKPILFGKAGNAEIRSNKQKLLVIVLCQSIRLMHPMIPFITEELFHILQNHFKEISSYTTTTESDDYTKECVDALLSSACIVAPYPQIIQSTDQDGKIEYSFHLMEQIVYTIRNLRGEMKIPPGVSTDIYIIGQVNDPDWQIVSENLLFISALIRSRHIYLLNEPLSSLSFNCSGAFRNIRIMLPLPEELVQQEKMRLLKEKEKLVSTVDKIKVQLENEEFRQKAPSFLIEKQEKQLMDSQKELEEIEAKLSCAS